MPCLCHIGGTQQCVLGWDGLSKRWGGRSARELGAVGGGGQMLVWLHGFATDTPPCQPVLKTEQVMASRPFLQRLATGSSTHWALNGRGPQAHCPALSSASLPWCSQCHLKALNSIYAPMALNVYLTRELRILIVNCLLDSPLGVSQASLTFISKLPSPPVFLISTIYQWAPPFTSCI